MQYDPTNPLIIQGDRSILVEVNNPKYAAARDALAPFAELEKSPEHIHTYRLTNLSLWNAAAAGLTAAQMVKVLQTFTKFPIPHNVAPDIEEVVQRYGRVRLERSGDQLKLVTHRAHEHRLEDADLTNRLREGLEQLLVESFPGLILIRPD